MGDVLQCWTCAGTETTQRAYRKTGKVGEFLFAFTKSPVTLMSTGVSIQRAPLPSSQKSIGTRSLPNTLELLGTSSWISSLMDIGHWTAWYPAERFPFEWITCAALFSVCSPLGRRRIFLSSLSPSLQRQAGRLKVNTE